MLASTFVRNVSTWKGWIGVWVVFLGSYLKLCSASNGDRSYIFQRCAYNCIHTNCTDIVTFQGKQPWIEQTLLWTCEDECKYLCMWKTVDAFKKDGMNVPQFYGKWPFERLWGMQEPASVLFSILNGLGHLRIFEYRRVVPSTTHMYTVWTIVAMNGMHTWMWSTVFHARDTVITEMMDYFCAFSLVLSNLFALLYRVFGVHERRKVTAAAVILVIFYLQHVLYLAFIKFDYGYNMKVNVGFGFINMVGWLYWCYQNRLNQGYVWKCSTVMVGLNLLLSLELGDFPPILWILDAHALWHAGTVPLVHLWYSFIIDDGLFLSTEQPVVKKIE